MEFGKGQKLVVLLLTGPSREVTKVGNYTYLLILKAVFKGLLFLSKGMKFKLLQCERHQVSDTYSENKADPS